MTIKNTFMAGRSQSADILINDETVSNQHLSITVYKDCVELTDNNSSNGSYIMPERTKFTKKTVSYQQKIALGAYETTPEYLLTHCLFNTDFMALNSVESNETRVSRYIRRPDGRFAKQANISNAIKEDAHNEQKMPFTRYIRDTQGKWGKK